MDINGELQFITIKILSIDGSHRKTVSTTVVATAPVAWIEVEAVTSAAAFERCRPKEAKRADIAEITIAAVTYTRRG